MTQSYLLDELNFETTIGGLGLVSNDTAIPLINLHDFDNCRDEITQQLWEAATQVGFFQIVDHGISLADIEKSFALSERFFSLPMETKQKFPLKEGLNAGWEFKQQVRPSTGTADQKESYQITLPHMDDLWPSNDVVESFESHLLSFEYQAWQLGMKILSCFADKLGFERDFFTKAHQRDSENYLSTLRMLHYLPMKEVSETGTFWRAGAHTDFDCLTMVFQQENQGGLQVAAGKDAKENLVWSTVEPKAGVITCNIGDMLMRWSDDIFKSTLHRVRMPTPEENQDSRYSMAFFCQANRDQIIQGPLKVYEPITAEDYLKMRINANFS
ncbi:isopenicillin N synthase family dioxygenase [Vibrio sp. FJH11]